MVLQGRTIPTSLRRNGDCSSLRRDDWLSTVRIFGAISAVYLGLYLIVPGCLCQLLNCFGVVPGDFSTRTEERLAFADDSHSTVCHCHDALSKTAEVTQSTESSSGTFASPIALLKETDLNVPSQKVAALGSGRAPPTVSLPSIASLRSFTGVYLI